MLRAARGSIAVQWILLLLLFAGSALYRIREFEAQPSFDPASDRLLFRLEAALHYRYARMVAEGQPIPVLDRRAQMPEGIDVPADLTVFMEIAAGRTYRALHGAGLVHAPFHVFLVRFVCVFSSLSIVAVFLLARAVWGSGPWALAAAAAYAVCPMSFDRTIGNYIREDFALPLLFLAIAFFFRALGASTARRGAVEACVAGILLLLGLRSWHLSRFILLLLGLTLPILAWAMPERRRLRDAVWIITGWTLLAALAFRGLQDKRLVASDAMFLLYASSLVLFLAERRGWGAGRTAGSILAAAAVLAGATRLLGGYGEYSHVYAFLVEKMRHLGIKPDDPLQLSFEARAMWVPPFTSPHAPYLVHHGGVFLAWGAAALAVGAWATVRGRLRGPGPAVLMWLAVYTLLFALIERMSSTLVFFLAVAIPALPRLLPRAVPALAAAMVVSLAWQAWQVAAGPGALTARWAAALTPPPAQDAFNFGNHRRLLEWARVATQPDDVFLTAFGTGPLLLVYADRPIVLHPKWETATIRRKCERFLDAMYGTEADLVRACEDWDVDYVVTQASFVLDSSKDSDRYVAGHVSVPAASPAFLMHFRPQELSRFTAVYQDSWHRVFRFHPAGQHPALAHRLPYEEVWDGVSVPAQGAVMDEALARQARDLLNRRIGLVVNAGALLAAGNLAGAAELARQLAELSPDAEEGWLLRARLDRLQGRNEDALAELGRGLETRPESAELWFERAEIQRSLGRGVRAVRAYEAVLHSNPGHAAARAILDAIVVTPEEAAAADPATP